MLGVNCEVVRYTFCLQDIIVLIAYFLPISYVVKFRETHETLNNLEAALA